MAAGRPEGFAVVYDRLGRVLLNVARAMLHDKSEAEDAVQDVFVELVRYRHRLAQVQDLEAYGFAVLRHRIWRRLKQQRQEQRRRRDRAAIKPAPEDADSTEELTAALAALPAKQREVIALKIDGGRTFAQIGQILQISPNTAASRYRYALEKLRQVLESSS